MIGAIKSLNLRNERALIRLDLNVPLKNGRVTDDFRIRAAIPTLKHCLENGASVVIMSHLGRPAGRVEDSMSLMLVGEPSSREKFISWRTSASTPAKRKMTPTFRGDLPSTAPASSMTRSGRLTDLTPRISA